MKWTRTTPTEEGFYWTRQSNGGGEFYIRMVFAVPDRKYDRLIYVEDKDPDEDWDDVEMRAEGFLEDDFYDWCGPIQEPTEQDYEMDN